MAEPRPVAVPPETMALVSTASQAQAAKVREVLDRMDAIARLEPDRLRGVVDMMRAARADGGCGIGCW